MTREQIEDAKAEMLARWEKAAKFGPEDFAEATLTVNKANVALRHGKAEMWFMHGGGRSCNGFCERLHCKYGMISRLRGVQCPLEAKDAEPSYPCAPEFNAIYKAFVDHSITHELFHRNPAALCKRIKALKYEDIQHA